MGLSPAEVALSVFDYVSNSIGICANLLLIFLVVKKSPKHIAVYSILLLNFGITDLVGCVAGLFVQQRLVQRDRETWRHNERERDRGPLIPYTPD